MIAAVKLWYQLVTDPLSCWNVSVLLYKYCNKLIQPFNSNPCSCPCCLYWIRISRPGSVRGVAGTHLQCIMDLYKGWTLLTPFVFFLTQTVNNCWLVHFCWFMCFGWFSSHKVVPSDGLYITIACTSWQKELLHAAVRNRYSTHLSRGIEYLQQLVSSETEVFPDKTVTSKKWPGCRYSNIYIFLTSII